MSRRLVNRSGSQRHGRGAPAASAVGDDDTDTFEPIEYEPPEFPLNDHARSKLGDLSRVRELSGYQNHMKEALRNLGLSVYDVQQRLSERRERLEQLRTRREERGMDKTADEERLEAHIKKLEREIGPLTDQSEAAVRQVIDLRAELEDDVAILGQLYTNAAVDNQNRQADLRNQGDEEAKAAVQSTISELHSERASRKRDYAATAAHQRYGLDNDYVGFKKLWRDGLAGDDGPPLPHATRWFRQDGTPVMGISIDALTGGHDDEDSDEELAVAREVISLNCPLTLRPLEQPYSNRKCKHTFEKSAIEEYLRSNREMQCPQTGCSQKFKRSDLQNDFYLDQVILRRIQRAKQNAKNLDMDVDSDDDEREESVVATGRRGRPGRALKTERA